MIVWEWTVPPQYLHVQLDTDSTPVPEQFLDTEKCVSSPFTVRSSDSKCMMHFDKGFFDGFLSEIEHLPRIEDEWIKEFGLGQPTVIVVVYVDMPEKIVDEVKALADKWITYKFLPSEEGFDYL